jgi:TPR repeat protein
MKTYCWLVAVSLSLLPGCASGQAASSKDLFSAVEANQAGNSYYGKRMYAEAVEQYSIAAEQNYAPAQASLGVMYRNGWGVKRDYAEAKRWYSKAAEQNNAAGQSGIGWLYQNGLGVTKDYAEAMRWYRKAVEQNYASAQANIGWLYQNGLGVAQDDAEAMRWYRKAAEQNYAPAQTNIGYVYEQGRGGIGRDLNEARKWYRKAAEQGNDAAKRNLERLGVGEGALIQMETYSVAAPAGDGWKVQKDQIKDMVAFRRDPLTDISVLPGYLRGTPDPTDDEDRVAAMIFAAEEKNMTDRGRSRSYAPTDITKDRLVIQGKRVHVMRYSIIQDRGSTSREPLLMKYAMYIYLPPNWNQSGKFYGFLIGAPQKIGEITYDPKLDEIESVIATFQLK